MQFFRLINTYVKQDKCFRSNIISTTNVIPLSLIHGLVQWFHGTDTLQSIIEQYRKLVNIPPRIEIELLTKYGYDKFNSLLPIQKMQIVERIFSETSDADLANFFWINAPSSNVWLQKTETFAISCGMTSIVGYIIGLGDRHPSNLLIDKFNGSVIHIDFGDCFEKASKRKILPETVPFRLTRMMIKAMGVTGINGLYKTSFINMSRILRENKNVLLMVLALFVHEPLADPDDAFLLANDMMKTSTSTLNLLSLGMNDTKLQSFETSNITNTELRKIIKNKLMGTEFNTDKALSIEEQAERLISTATNIYNLSKQFHGWCPFW